MRLMRFGKEEGHIAELPAVGRRLRRARRVKYIPPVDHIGMVYAASQGELCTFIALGYTTGLRFADILAVRHENIQRERRLIQIVAQKTGKPQTLPLFDCVLRFVDPEIVAGPLFTMTRYDVRRGLKRACRKLGIPMISPQAIRRTSANAYEHARPGAGKALLGHSIDGASGFYLHVPRILRQAADGLEVPREM